MKIIFITPYFIPKIGGLENYAATVANGLLQKGHEVLVVTTNHHGKQRLDETIDGLRIIRLPLLFVISNTPFNPQWYFSLRKIFREEKPDIINAHTPVPGLADMAFLAKGKTKFITTYHAGTMKKGSLMVDLCIGAYEQIILKRMLRLSTEIIGNYPTFIESLLHDKPRLNVVAPGVDTSLFKPAKKISKVRPTLLFVGRIEHSSTWKGIATLIASMRVVVAEHPDVLLKVIGSGDAVPHFQKMVIDFELQENVIFPGALRGLDLAAEYQKSKMLILPSESDAESFGIVLIEAMASGIPVIGSRIGGIPNVIHDGTNGLLVPPKKPKTLATAIMRLLNHPAEAQELGNNGMVIAREKYSSAALVAKTEAIFTRCLHPAIVHVVATYPPQLGGMEKVAYELAKAQSVLGERVSVITSNQGVKGALGPPDPISVSRLWSFSFANTPIIPGLLYRLMRVSSDAIVHLHVAQAYTPEIVWVASKLKGFKYIAHVHLDIGPSGNFGFLLSTYKSLFLKRVLSDSKAIVVFDKEQKKQLASNYGIDTSRIAVVPNGVGPEFYSNPHSLHATPRLLFVGRLSAQKNIPQLIRALNGISDKVKTTIVGDGVLKKELVDLSHTLKLKNVTFKGRLEGDTLLTEYRQADVFVLPSEREGMPLVLLEAMASGLAVVGTDVPGIRKLVTKNNGVLVKLHDENAMRQAILELTNNPVAYGAKSNGALATAHNYSWETVVQMFSQLYSDVRQ